MLVNFIEKKKKEKKSGAIVDQSKKNVQNYPKKVVMGNKVTINVNNQLPKLIYELLESLQRTGFTKTIDYSNRTEWTFDNIFTKSI